MPNRMFARAVPRAIAYWNNHWWTKALFLAAIFAVLLAKADLGHLAHSFATVDWRWLALAVALNVLVILMKGLNLKVVYDALGVGRARVMEVFSATSIGLMVNWLVPARLGEVARAYALQRSLRDRELDVPLAAVFGTVLSERLFAIAALVALSAVLLFGTVMPPWASALLVGGAVFAGAAIVALAFYERWRKRRHGAQPESVQAGGRRRLHVPRLHPPHLHAPHLHAPHVHPPHAPRRLRHMLGYQLIALGESQRIMGKPLPALLEFGLQVATWVVQLGLYYAMMLALHLDGATASAAMLVMVVTNIIGLVPLTPGNWGTFQAAAVGALVLTGFNGQDALAYAIGVQGMQTIVGVTLGFLFLSLADLTIAEVESASLQETEEIEDELEERAATGDEPAATAAVTGDHDEERDAARPAAADEPAAAPPSGSERGQVAGNDEARPPGSDQPPGFE